MDSWPFFYVRQTLLAANHSKAIAASTQFLRLQILPWNLQLVFADARKKTGFNIREELLARKYTEKNPRTFAVSGF
jgi:hypothetical protein